MSLAGRVCLVVGGVRGIGAVISDAFEREGATVIATSHAAASSDGRQASHLDVRDERSIVDLADQVRSDRGRLDVLVYNSGVAGPTKDLDAVDANEWLEVMDVNVTGFYRTCRAFIPLMRESDAARIIAIASMTGRRPLLNRVPYAASKTALMGFARSLALELGPYGITVNTVSPGYVAGERIDAVIERQAQARGSSADEIRDLFVEQSPLHRLVAPESVARAVSFLADSATCDITGTDINVSAGVWMD